MHYYAKVWLQVSSALVKGSQAVSVAICTDHHDRSCMIHTHAWADSQRVFHVDSLCHCEGGKCMAVSASKLIVMVKKVVLEAERCCSHVLKQTYIPPLEAKWKKVGK